VRRPAKAGGATQVSALRRGRNTGSRASRFTGDVMSGRAGSKRKRPSYYSPYRLMWVLVMFDLPVMTKEQRRDYAQFRKKLKARGFDALQYSVYARPCPSEENAKVHKERVQRDCPPEGEVRIMMITDKQFQRMEVFFGKKAVATEKRPEQLAFF